MTSIVNSTTNEITQQARSLPRTLLNLEGLATFIASIALYNFIGGNWWLFIALLFTPDLVFIIYMLDKGIGTIAYNLAHTYSFPITLGVISLLMGWQFGILLAVIWFAHIGMDRTIGYGLKYPSAFKDTHLQRA